MFYELKLIAKVFPKGRFNDSSRDILFFCQKKPLKKESVHEHRGDLRNHQSRRMRILSVEVSSKYIIFSVNWSLEHITHCCLIIHEGRHLGWDVWWGVWGVCRGGGGLIKQPLEIILKSNLKA